MSAEPLPYSPLYIKAWTLLSAVVSFAFFIAFLFGPHFLHTGHWIWDLIRYLASPII